MMKAYGKELIIDLHDCAAGPFGRSFIEAFLIALCNVIGMTREALHFWDYDGDPEGYRKAPEHLKGTSAVQFIATSTIVIHALDDLGKVFLNIFSCKDFDADRVVDFCEGRFDGKAANVYTVERT